MSGGPRVGLIARADDRGLGHLTWEFARHLDPAQVLVVDLGPLSPFPNHLDRYPGATVARWTEAGFVDVDQVRAWCESVDVVYTAETPYDWRLFDWCRAAGVASVLHAMPELLDARQVAAHPPTEVWVPTRWRLDHVTAAIGGPPKVVGVPVALDRFPTPEPRDPGPLRILHVAGRRAMADRNGTSTLARAVREIRSEVVVTVTTQDDRLPTIGAPRSGEVVVVRPTGEYSELYRGHDLLVLPRRYGGLSLPVQEAAGAGLGIVLPDVAPNRDYPALLVPAWLAGTETMKGGQVDISQTDHRALARTIDRVAADPALLADARSEARSWAERASWGVAAPTYREALEGALAGLS